MTNKNDNKYSIYFILLKWNVFNICLLQMIIYYITHISQMFELKDNAITSFI